MDIDISQHIADYRRKRDLIFDGLSDVYEVARPNGAFYAYRKAPWGTATEFVTEAVRNNLLVIPGNVFSRRDTHFRISYAAADDVLQQGVDVLRHLANGPG